MSNDKCCFMPSNVDQEDQQRAGHSPWTYSPRTFFPHKIEILGHFPLPQFTRFLVVKSLSVN